MVWHWKSSVEYFSLAFFAFMDVFIVPFDWNLFSLQIFSNISNKILLAFMDWCASGRHRTWSMSSHCLEKAIFVDVKCRCWIHFEHLAEGFQQTWILCCCSTYMWLVENWFGNVAGSLMNSHLGKNDTHKHSVKWKENKCILSGCSKYQF